MKKLLSTLVLSSSFVTAFGATLDVSFELNDKNFSQSVSFDENQPSALTLESDFAVIELSVEAQDEKVLVNGTIFAKEAEGATSLLSQPVIEATFNDAATITVAANDESNSSYSLTVLASK
jgi:hypothetical protein